MGAASGKDHSAAFWWAEDDKHVAEAIVQRVRDIEEAQRYVHERNLKHDLLYNQQDTPGLGWSLGNRATGSSLDRKPGTDNVIRQVTDTATAIIARQRPRPVVQTAGASWSRQQNAKRLTKFIEGTLRSAGVYEEAPRFFRDACIYGTAAWKICENKSKLGTALIERVHIDDIIVDELQCRTQRLPRELHHRHFVHKEVLKGLFPKFSKEIEAAAGSDQYRQWTGYRRTPTNMVPLIESYWRPSGESVGDGRYVCTAPGVVFADYEWERDDFPYVFMHWRAPTGGFYGHGIASELINIQLRLNQVNRYIAMAQDQMAAPRWAVMAGSIVDNAFSNKIGEMIYYRRGYERPIPFVPDAVKPEMYNYRRELITMAHEQVGVNRLASQGLKPAGLDAAVAMREYNDLQSQRFAPQAMAFEASFIDMGWSTMYLMKELQDGGKKPRAIWNSKSLVEQIDWSEVEPEEEDFVISVEASSLLVRTPAARQQTVVEWYAQQLIDRDEARRLVGHPDLEEAYNFVTAAIENVDWKIERVARGIPSPPSSMDNLSLYKQRMTAAYHMAEMQEAPQNVVSLYRNHVQQADALEKQAKAAMMAEQQAEQMAMQPPAPAAGPGPAPGMALAPAA